MTLTCILPPLQKRPCSSCRRNKFRHDIRDRDRSVFFQRTNEVELLHIINSFKNKLSSGVDGIPMTVIKYTAEEIISPLNFIMNNSIKSGIFPDCLKLALVKPILKKGDKEKIENYRPISLLPSFSKILEAVMLRRLSSFLEEVVADSQHGFRRGRSTKTAIYSFLKNIHQALENGKITIGLFLDLSKAFDSLSHDYIIDR